MKKLICLFVMVMLLSGCAEFRRGWNEGAQERQVAKYGANCESCNRNFTVEDLNSSETVICPYCGREQNLRYAINRYAYSRQQQEAQANQQMWTNISNKMQDIQIRHDEAEQRNIQQFQQNIADWNANWQKSHNQVGTRWNPMHVTVDDD